MSRAARRAMLEEEDGLSPFLSEGRARQSLFQKISFAPRITPNSLMLSLLGGMTLVMLGFLPVYPPNPLHIDPHLPISAQPEQISYTVQLPFALFLAVLLGPFMGAGAMLLFLLTGLCFLPVFANGGGWDYLLEPGFGYLAGTLIAAWMVGKGYYQAFQRRERESRSLKILAKAVIAVLIIHGAGVVYMLGLTLLGRLALGDLPGWFFRLSVETLPYDLLATIALFGLVRLVRLTLWPVLY